MAALTWEGIEMEMKQIQLTGFEQPEESNRPHLRLLKDEKKIGARIKLLGRIENLSCYQAKNGLRQLL
ncbi:hypothetical protein [Pedobacter yulinensis]|uniref:hypothetical protein n=1 Tax=Pedobacter yulinensis TaxID=2126353 RepID=UPI0013A6735E|nr:hypothetical protein [Pedobacter yulinensis]